MKYINIYGKKRNIKNNIDLIRKNQWVPCILYGKNINISFSTALIDIKKLIKYNIYGVILTIEDEIHEVKTIIKEIQFDPINNKILHVDFYKINENKPIVLEVPIKIIGRPIGIKKGGEYYVSVKKLKIKSLPDNIPNNIELDISHLDIGDKIIVSNLKNVKYDILYPSYDVLIVKVKYIKSSVTDTSTNTSTKEDSIKENKLKDEEKDNKKK